MTARGLRNNNPGNIVDGLFTQGIGGYAGTDGRFAKFETMAQGIHALVALLKIYRTKHKLTTVSGIINRWAPPVENVTSAYVEAVCDGWVRPDEELPDTRETYLFLAQRIARHENGPEAAAISPEVWAEGLALAGLAGEPIQPKPVEKKVGPFTPILWEVLSTSIPSLIRHFGKGDRAEANAKTMEVVTGIAKEAIGAVNEQEVIERVKSDPTTVQTIDNAVTSQWFSIVEAGGGGIAGARELYIRTADKPMWQQPAFIVSIVLLVFPTMLCVDTFFVHPGFYAPEIKTQIVTGVLMTIGIVGGFWLGSSFTTSSSRGLGGAK